MCEPRWSPGSHGTGRSERFCVTAAGCPSCLPSPPMVSGELLFRNTGAVGTTGGTFYNRVPGQPLFTQDLNCHCFDPNTNFRPESRRLGQSSGRPMGHIGRLTTTIIAISGVPRRA